MRRGSVVSTAATAVSATTAAASTATAATAAVAAVSTAVAAVSTAVTTTVAAVSAAAAVSTAAAAVSAAAAAVSTTAAAVSTAAAAVSTTAATVSTTAATAARLTFVGFVDAERAAVEFGPVHFLEGGFRRGIVLKGYEAEASRSSGLTVGDDTCVRDLSEARERFLKALIGGRPCEPAYKQFLRHHQDSVKTPRRPSFGTPHSTRC